MSFSQAATRPPGRVTTVHFLEDALRLLNVLEEVASGHQVEAGVGEVQRVSIALHAGHARRLNRRGGLRGRLFDGNQPHVAGRRCDLRSKNPQPAANLQNTLTGPNVQEFDEGPVRQPFQLGEALLLARLGPVDVSPRGDLVELMARLERPTCES
jgi:hypothetical protein